MQDYFVYLPDRPMEEVWPCRVTATGFAHVPPQAPYPPLRHPEDHHFSWSAGRILHAYQLVFITHGSGVYESKGLSRIQQIEPGTLFLLFPGIWHRYAPSPETGWVEHWIECRGQAWEEAHFAGIIRPEEPVVRIGSSSDIQCAFDLCHDWARRPPPVNQPALASLSLYLLAILSGLGNPTQAPNRHIDQIVQQAQALIARRYQEPLEMVSVARELGVGYSRFREAFRSRTGLSPKQYHLEVRLQKAQDLLANTGKTIKEVAEILGFDSAFHLSSQFKTRTGLSPKRWRTRLQSSSGVPEAS